MAVLYRLLGGLERNVDPLSEAPTETLPTQRVRNLLALLLVTPGKVWSRQALQGELYPAVDAAAARARLSDHLYSLRRSSPELDLRVDRETVSWTGRGAETDLRAFLASLGESSLPRLEDLEQLAAALDLYRGDLLPEVDLPSIDSHREHARGRYALGVRTLGQRLEAVSRLVEAQRLYDRWLVAHPGDEAVVLRYLNLCQELGQRARGLEVFAAAEASWGALGVGLPRELREAASRLKSSARVARPAPTAYGDGLSKVDRAWWLLSESQAQQALLEGPGDGEPELWQLRTWMLVEIRGDWAALGTGLQSYLGTVAHRGDVRDPGAEALALILLGRSQSERDTVHEASLSYDKASALLRQVVESSVRRAPALSAFAPAEALLAYLELLQLNLQLLRGQADAALEACRRLCARLEERERTSPEAWVAVLSLRAMASLGALLLQAGRSWEAVSWLERAQALGQRLDATEFLDTQAISLASALDNLGRWDESGPLLAASAQRWTAQTDPFKLGKVLYNLAAHHGNRPDGNLELAVSLGRQAVDAFRRVDSLGWEASTHTTLGFLCWQRGCYGEALDEYAVARELHTRLQEEFFLTEIAAYEALCYRDLGDTLKAVLLSRQAVESSLALGETTVNCDLWFVYSECLRAAGAEEEAEPPLRRAAERLFDEASALPDPEACGAFLQRDPVVRALIARLRERHLISEYLARLPLSVYAEGVVSSPAPASLRRARLRDTLDRLRTRGERPSAAMLARLLGAGVRTIERDLAWLKHAPTGGGFRR